MDLKLQQNLGAEVAAAADALARGSVDVQFDAVPGLRERLGAVGVAKSYDDAKHNLAFLAESVSLGDPQSFIQYALWLDGVLNAAKVPKGLLAAHFRCLKELAQAHLSPAAAEQCTQRLDAAVTQLDAHAAKP